MVAPLTGLGMIAGLAAELVGLRAGRRAGEIAQQILDRTRALEEEVGQFHREVLDAIENQPDHAEMKRLIEELPERLGAMTPEADIRLQVLDLEHGGSMNPCFHRRINDKSKRRTEQMEVTGTAFRFHLRIENNGEKRTVIDDVFLKAEVGGEPWLVTGKATTAVEGVHSKLPVPDECLKPGELLSVNARAHVDRTVFLVTDQTVPHDVTEIVAEVHCKPRWGTSQAVSCKFPRTKEH